VRSTVVIALALASSACSILDRIEFGRSSLDPNRIYLSAEEMPVTVSPRDTHRYACVGTPLICLQRGVSFECRCP
jgi:hypothetical protein